MIVMNENIELLQYIYKDASMAVYTIENLLKDLKEKGNKINKVCEDILKGYERYTKDTKKRLSKLKQDGLEEGMMAKMGAKMGIKKEVIHDNSDSNIADLLIRGISMGSIDMEKKIERYQDNVEKDNLKLAKDFYQFQQENIEALKKFL